MNSSAAVVDSPAGIAYTDRGGSVLQLSRRRVAQLVAYCLQYEFEAVAGLMMEIDRVEPTDEPLLERSRRIYRLLHMLGGSSGLAQRFAAAPQVRLTRNYDLFLPVFNHAYELYTLACVPGWRERCKKAVCFINEYWPTQNLPDYLLDMLGQFDQVYVAMHQAVDSLRERSSAPITYMPLAVDVQTFAPLPRPAARSINVCNIGRRSDITHQAFLAIARERRIHYHYDTAAASGHNKAQRTFIVEDPAAHRMLLASTLRRSCYFIANRAQLGNAEYESQRDEISGRFAEGAAAGTVMLGEAPRTEVFKQLFDWQDAVIHLPYDSADAAERLAELDADPARLDRARRQGVHNAALRHDWVHRLRTMFESVDLPPTPGMLEREARLKLLAKEALDSADPI